MALLKLELLARVLMASGIPVTKTVSETKEVYDHLFITPKLSVYLLKSDFYLVHFLMDSGETESAPNEELHVVVKTLRDMIDDFTPAFTRVRLEGDRYQPDFQQMDHAEIIAWRLDEIGYDWVSDEPDIGLEEFQEMAQDHWEEAMAAEEVCKRETLERDTDSGEQDGQFYA